MAFKDIDQHLIHECTKDRIDLDIIKGLIADGADINAFDNETEQSLFDEILDHYIFESKVRPLEMSNLYSVSKLFVEIGLVLNPKPSDAMYFSLHGFKFLPPEEICIDIFKLLLEKCTYSFQDIDNMSLDATLDLHLGEYYFFEQNPSYSKTDSLTYFLELIYWASAYTVREFPDNCSADLLSFDWFNRSKNKIEIVRKNRSTSVFVEDLETHNRAEIDGWSQKY